MTFIDCFVIMNLKYALQIKDPFSLALPTLSPSLISRVLCHYSELWLFRQG